MRSRLARAIATNALGWRWSFPGFWLAVGCQFLPLSSASTARPPSWQTVFPDTNIIVPLFGEDGPGWRLVYHDTVVGTPAAAKEWMGNWTARVPGDVVSDLMQHGVVRDPYWDKNLWEDQEHWLGPQRPDKKKDPFSPCQLEQTRIWSYYTEFELDTSPAYSWQLIVESLQMGASLYWNGIFLGNITDQFLRYSLTITENHWRHAAYLTSGRTKHNLTVTFDPSIDTDGRFMACAGGWDWAPYTLACDAKQRRIFTMGIVQPIYLIAVDQFAVSHVVPKVYYQGETLPRRPMDSKHPDADFKVKLDVHLEFVASNSSQSAYWLAATSDFATMEQRKAVVPLSDGGASSIITFTMIAPRDKVQLWWPNGMGSQPLYHVMVGIRSQERMNTASDRFLAKSNGVWISKRIGFRTSAIVTVNETEDNSANLRLEDDSDGTGMHGMYWRINGALVMARGANIIPADQLERQTNGKTYQIIVQSAASAKMNMIRVWGGGKVLPQAFYDACDEKGILLYHDQMFVDEGLHGPIKTPTIEKEIQHVVRSLASHPSITVWNGCNECQVVMGTDNEIYATFVMQTVVGEDDTRSIWPSSPSMYGWKSGVNRYDSTPNGQPLATRNPADHKDSPKLETHGPYQRAFSNTFPGVNGVDQHFPYPAKPNKLYQGKIGPEYPNSFASEFGCSVWSSFESVSGTLSPEHWGFHGGAPPDKCQHLVGQESVCEGSNVMAQRNYPCDRLVEGYFGNATSLDEVGEKAFQAQLFQCMMGQTLWMKGDIELRRSENSFGVLIWQLNENWPTGGWGLLEYSGTQPGQVLGGRWKPLMHLLEKVLFSDVIAACGYGNRCYLRNDGMGLINATVTLEAWNIAGSRNRCSVSNFTFEATLPGGVSSTVLFQAPSEWTSDQYDTILIRVSDKQSGASLMTDNVFLWSFPKSIPNLITTKVTVTIQSVQPRPDNRTAVVLLSSDALALYVVLTTRAPGRFDDNAFVLRPHQQKVVSFLPLSEEGEVDIELLRQSIRVEHLAYYFQ